MSYAQTPRSSLGQTTQPSCPPGQFYTMGTCTCPAEAPSIPKPACCIPGPPIDACGHQDYDCSSCPPPAQTRPATSDGAQAIDTIRQIPAAYADMIAHPTARWMPARVTSLATGVLGIAGLVSWISRGRSAPTHLKVATPLLIVTSLVSAGFRNGVG